MNLKVFTAFSGYDSQCMALDRLHEHNLHFNYELVGWAEIDKYAIQAHNAVYPQWADRNYGDISRIDWQQVPDFDLFTYSSPCQDFSQAGKQAGGTEGSSTKWLATPSSFHVCTIFGADSGSTHISPPSHYFNGVPDAP